MSGSGPVAALTDLSLCLRELHDGQMDPSTMTFGTVPIADAIKAQALGHSLTLDRIIDTLKERGL